MFIVDVEYEKFSLICLNYKIIVMIYQIVDDYNKRSLLFLVGRK